MDSTTIFFGGNQLEMIRDQYSACMNNLHIFGASNGDPALAGGTASVLILFRAWVNCTSTKSANAQFSFGHHKDY